MQVNAEGYALIKKFEGCKLKAYRCPANVLTIGYGNTFYENGDKVKEGDVITQQRAEELAKFIIDQFAVSITPFIKQPLTENQFSACVSLAYNIGTGNFKKSSVFKKLNINPNDATIADSFRLWNKGGGVVLKGLVRRREAEIQLYFK
jgi:lysozyme|tara:strand:- start:1911 stop:2354 length:444 start_codon:yes stop_codon:yes gene_type:complete